MAAPVDHVYDPQNFSCACLGAHVWHNTRGQVYVYDAADEEQVDYYSDVEDYLREHPWPLPSSSSTPPVTN